MDRHPHEYDSYSDQSVLIAGRDATLKILGALDLTAAEKTETDKIILHMRHRKRGYVGTVVIESHGALAHKVSYSPAVFRRACEAAAAAMADVAR